MTTDALSPPAHTLITGYLRSFQLATDVFRHAGAPLDKRSGHGANERFERWALYHMLIGPFGVEAKDIEAKIPPKDRLEVLGPISDSDLVNASPAQPHNALLKSLALAQYSAANTNVTLPVEDAADTVPQDFSLRTLSTRVRRAIDNARVYMALSNFCILAWAVAFYGHDRVTASEASIDLLRRFGAPSCDKERDDAESADDTATAAQLVARQDRLSACALRYLLVGLISPLAILHSRDWSRQAWNPLTSIRLIRAIRADEMVLTDAERREMREVDAILWREILECAVGRKGPEHALKSALDECRPRLTRCPDLAVMCQRGTERCFPRVADPPSQSLAPTPSDEHTAGLAHLQPTSAQANSSAIRRIGIALPDAPNRPPTPPLLALAAVAAPAPRLALSTGDLHPDAPAPAPQAKAAAAVQRQEGRSPVNEDGNQLRAPSPPAGPAVVKSSFFIRLPPARLFGGGGGIGIGGGSCGSGTGTGSGGVGGSGTGTGSGGGGSGSGGSGSGGTGTGSGSGSGGGDGDGGQPKISSRELRRQTSSSIRTEGAAFIELASSIHSVIKVQDEQREALEDVRLRVDDVLQTLTASAVTLAGVPGAASMDGQRKLCEEATSAAQSNHAAAVELLSEGVELAGDADKSADRLRPDIKAFMRAPPSEPGGDAQGDSSGDEGDLEPHQALLRTIRDAARNVQGAYDSALDNNARIEELLDIAVGKTKRAEKLVNVIAAHAAKEAGKIKTPRRPRKPREPAGLEDDRPARARAARAPLDPFTKAVGVLRKQHQVIDGAVLGLWWTHMSPTLTQPLHNAALGGALTPLPRVDPPNKLWAPPLLIDGRTSSFVVPRRDGLEENSEQIRSVFCKARYVDESTPQIDIVDFRRLDDALLRRWAGDRSKRLLVVRRCPPEFPRRTWSLASLSTLLPTRDAEETFVAQDLHKRQEGTGASPHVLASISDIFASDPRGDGYSPVGRIINGLSLVPTDLPTGTPLTPVSAAFGVNAVERVLVAYPFLAPRANNEPFELVANSGADHPPHVDALGAVAGVVIESGEKLWAVAWPKTDVAIDPAGPAFFSCAGGYHAVEPNLDRLDWSFVSISGGYDGDTSDGSETFVDMLIMKPGVPHAVVTTRAAVCHGAHYYALEAMQDTLDAVLHQRFANQELSNTEPRDHSFRMLARLLLSTVIRLAAQLEEPHGVELEVLCERTFCSDTLALMFTVVFGEHLLLPSITGGPVATEVRLVCMRLAGFLAQWSGVFHDTRADMLWRDGLLSLLSRLAWFRACMTGSSLTPRPEFPLEHPLPAGTVQQRFQAAYTRYFAYLAQTLPVEHLGQPGYWGPCDWRRRVPSSPGTFMQRRIGDELAAMARSWEPRKAQAASAARRPHTPAKRRLKEPPFPDGAHFDLFMNHVLPNISQAEQAGVPKSSIRDLLTGLHEDVPEDQQQRLAPYLQRAPLSPEPSPQRPSKKKRRA